MDYIVYKHTTPDGKVYIGQTKNGMIKRAALENKNHWKNHEYGKNVWGYSTQEFGKAIKQFGWENIKHEILYSGLTEEESLILEKEMIAKYKANDPQYGYNQTAGGKGCSMACKEETKEKISKGLERYYENHRPGNIRKIDCFYHGEYYKTYDSIQDAMNDLHITAYNSITNILKGRAAKTKQGYSFVYK